MSSSTKTGKALAHRIAVANRAHAISGVLLNIVLLLCTVAALCAIFTTLANPGMAAVAVLCAVVLANPAGMAAVAAVISAVAAVEVAVAAGLGALAAAQAEGAAGKIAKAGVKVAKGSVDAGVKVAKGSQGWGLAVGVVALDAVIVAVAVGGVGGVVGWVVGALAAVGLVVVAGAYVYKRKTAREAAPGKEAVEAYAREAVEDAAGNVVEAQLGAQAAAVKALTGVGGGRLSLLLVRGLLRS